MGTTETGPSAARRLAMFASGPAPAAMPEAVRARIARSVADTIACAAAGAVRAGRLGLEGVPRDTSAGDAGRTATLIGGGTATPRTVALHNGTWTRFLDFNDTFAPRRPNTNGHFSDGTLGILAVAEAIGSSGRDLIDALIVSYEVQGWLAQRFRWREAGYHAASVTPFGVALAVGRLLGCDEDQLTSAAGTVASTAMVSDTWLRPGGGVIGTIKALTAGLTSQSGILIAELASGGLTAPEDAIEEVWRRSTVAPPPHPGSDPGEELLSLRTSVKRYPSQIYTQSIAQAGALAHTAGARLDTAVRIEVRSHDRACAEVQGSPQAFRPASRGDADHSTPFVLARMLQSGSFTLRSYDGEPWRDPTLLEAMQRMELIVDPDAQRAFLEDGMHPATVRVTDQSGQVHEGHVPQFSGHPDQPLDDDELAEKLTELVDDADVWGAGAGERLLVHCLGLDGMPAVRELAEFLGAPLGAR